jgi:hypothetical protein
MERLHRDLSSGPRETRQPEAGVSRRGFLHALAGSAGLLGMGAFLESCREKKVLPSSELARAYVEELSRLIRLVHERELPTIQRAAAQAIQAKLEGHNLYAWMTGGMLDGEMGDTRPGAPQFLIKNNIRNAVRYDFIITDDPYSISDSSERLIKVIGITRPSLLSNETPLGALENMGTMRIEDIAEFIIYSHVPAEDGILSAKGVDFPIGPASGIVHTFLYNALAAEIAEGLIQKGIYPRVS